MDTRADALFPAPPKDVVATAALFYDLKQVLSPDAGYAEVKEKLASQISKIGYEGLHTLFDWNGIAVLPDENNDWHVLDPHRVGASLAGRLATKSTILAAYTPCELTEEVHGSPIDFTRPALAYKTDEGEGFTFSAMGAWIARGGIRNFNNMMPRFWKLPQPYEGRSVSEDVVLGLKTFAWLQMDEPPASPRDLDWLALRQELNKKSLSWELCNTVYRVLSLGQDLDPALVAAFSNVPADFNHTVSGWLRFEAKLLTNDRSIAPRINPLLERLLGSGVDLHPSPGQHGLLHHFAGVNHGTLVAALLDAGHDPFAQNQQGQTPLQCAHANHCSETPAVITSWIARQQAQQALQELQRGAGPSAG